MVKLQRPALSLLLSSRVESLSKTTTTIHQDDNSENFVVPGPHQWPYVQLPRLRLRRKKASYCHHLIYASKEEEEEEKRSCLNAQLNFFVFFLSFFFVVVKTTTTRATQLQQRRRPPSSGTGPRAHEHN